MDDHSPGYRKLIGRPTHKKKRKEEEVITSTIILATLSPPIPLFLSSSSYSVGVYEWNPVRGITQYQIACRPDEVNCNVYETLTLTTNQDTETTCKSLSINNIRI